MTEQELRTLVRQAIARVQGGSPDDAGRILSGPRFSSGPPQQHASHGLLPVLSGADEDGPCLIEPAVPCNHCGYCKSLGH